MIQSLMNEVANTGHQLLSQELRVYGLNPSDWTLIQEDQKRYRIQSNSDRGFSFLGYAREKAHALCWDHIELFSL